MNLRRIFFALIVLGVLVTGVGIASRTTWCPHFTFVLSSNGAIGLCR